MGAPGVAGSSELHAEYGQSHGRSEPSCAVVVLVLLSAPQMWALWGVSQNIMQKDALSGDVWSQLHFSAHRGVQWERTVLPTRQK